MQVQLTRRAGKGLNTMVAYTLAKAEGDTDGGNFGSAYGTNQIQDIFDLDAARSIQSFDVRHRLSVSVQYDLPLVDEGTGLAAQLLGGWQVNAIVTAQTGTANGVIYGNDTSNPVSVHGRIWSPNRFSRAPSGRFSGGSTRRHSFRRLRAGSEIPRV
jgi:hypothetical protein